MAESKTDLEARHGTEYLTGVGNNEKELMNFARKGFRAAYVEQTI